MLRAKCQSAQMSKNYKWCLNPVWHRMLYNCTHMATVGLKRLNEDHVCRWVFLTAWKLCLRCICLLQMDTFTKVVMSLLLKAWVKQDWWEPVSVYCASSWQMTIGSATHLTSGLAVIVDLVGDFQSVQKLLESAGHTVWKWETVC